ncbi:MULTISPECIES: NUDIX domain-containing protein [unclassified Nocardiopsis]|uniref:NUDIX domain-containing protein n=1 Tax=unclassified Nocardiopsis TaxID=2649073 RepID=UPI001F40CC6A|nr:MULTISPECIES: NUDIX domain-containing protein [unclassified Nocardiopsis]
MFCGEEVALIRRDRAASTHHTPQGGNVEPGEDLFAALPRELGEELDPGPHRLHANRTCSTGCTSPPPFAVRWRRRSTTSNPTAVMR